MEAGWRGIVLVVWHEETVAREKVLLREGLVDRGHLNVFLHNI